MITFALKGAGEGSIKMRTYANTEEGAESGQSTRFYISCIMYALRILKINTICIWGSVGKIQISKTCFCGINRCLLIYAQFREQDSLKEKEF